MDDMAEPVRNKRIHLGIIVLMFLGVLFFFAYWMKREYWKDLH
jgi:ubiquinol-cytochrome c reductase cytochrome c1 subunit